MFELLSRRFRAAPGLDCIPFDRLPGDSWSQLGALHNDPTLYGVICAADGSSHIRAVDRDTALLFLTLRDPGPIPAYARRLLGAECREVITNLVLDGVLEVEVVEGRFTSGARFHELMLPDGAPSVLADEDSTELVALKLVSSLRWTDAPKASRELYAFGRLPCSSRWKDWGLQSSGDRARSLGAVTRTLGSDWRVDETIDWITWTRRTGWAGTSRRAKLYLSPQPDHLFAVLPEVAAITERLGVSSFKIARTLRGMLRPDKMVLYWPGLEDALAASPELLHLTSGVPGHRVPFTARIEGSDTLSYGIDPPLRELVVPWQSPSWRGWVVEKLVGAMVAAQLSPAIGSSAWQHALWGAHRAGIDTKTWSPRQGVWDVV